MFCYHFKVTVVLEYIKTAMYYIIQTNSQTFAMQLEYRAVQNSENPLYYVHNVKHKIQRSYLIEYGVKTIFKNW